MPHIPELHQLQLMPPQPPVEPTEIQTFKLEGVDLDANFPTLELPLKTFKSMYDSLCV